jgi:hypothetical protein
MGGDAHLFARLGQEVIVLGAPLFGAGFGAAWAEGKKISGDGAEQLLEESGLFARLAGRGVDSLGEVGQRVQGSSEGHPRQSHTVLDGSLRKRCAKHRWKDHSTAGMVLVEA